MTELIDHWDATDHARGLIAEALLAQLLYREYGPASTVWEAPRHRGYDVTSRVTGEDTPAFLVDAKVTTHRPADLGDGMCNTLEWRGRQGAQQVIEPTTHLGLVVLSASTSLRFIDGQDGKTGTTLGVDGHLEADRVYLIPAAVANSDHVVPIWSALLNRYTTGAYRYIRTTHVEGPDQLPGVIRLV